MWSYSLTKKRSDPLSLRYGWRQAVEQAFEITATCTFTEIVVAPVVLTQYTL